MGKIIFKNFSTFFEIIQNFDMKIIKKNHKNYNKRNPTVKRSKNYQVPKNTQKGAQP